VPLDLSDLDTSVLVRSPLTSVICQIRFNHSPRASDAQIASDFYEALGGKTGRYPKLEQIAETAINVSVGPNVPAAVAQQAPVSGWRMSSADGQHVVSLLPTSIALEATTYEGWDQDFGPRLDEMLDCVERLVEPVFEQRVGLRYINQVVETEVRAPEGWREWIDAQLLGLITNDEIGPMVVFARQQAILQLDEEARCTWNHGFVPDPDREGTLAYLLDYDIAREGMRPFDRHQIRNTLNLFNCYALRLFQLSTTPALRERLGH
jgi:uncharacterized protein (TIGR04255 family)